MDDFYQQVQANFNYGKDKKKDKKDIRTTATSFEKQFFHVQQRQNIRDYLL